MLLDADKNGTIDLDEFVAGCMQLHGPAKSLQHHDCKLRPSPLLSKGKPGSADFVDL